MQARFSRQQLWFLSRNRDSNSPLRVPSGRCQHGGPSRGIIGTLAATFTTSRVETRPNWAEVSLSALRHNFQALQQHLGPQVTICAVVKCNAYGHGVEECAPALEQTGANWFGVTSTDEGIVLRECGITARILVMCGLYPGEEEDALRYSLTPAVFRLEQAEALAAAAARLKLDHPAAVHLKIDTGMARL